MHIVDWFYGGCGTGNSRGGNGRRRWCAAVPAVGLGIYMMGSVAAVAGDLDTSGNVQRLQAPQRTSIAFAAIGDYGDDSSAARSVARLVDGWTPEFIIGLGDNRYGKSNFDQVVGQFYCDYLADVGTGNYCNGGTSPSNTFFPVLGNHDYKNGGGVNEYLDYFTLPGDGVVGSATSGNERYYDFVIGPVHFFALDSQGALKRSSDMAAQRAWLQAQLAASTSAWQVVLFHHAAYSSAKHGSTTGMQWPFAAWGADAVINGHDHTYERVEFDGIPYFVNGLGGKSIYNFGTPVPGSQLRYNGAYGAMHIVADNAQMTFQFINIAGEVIDSFTMRGQVIPPLAATLKNHIASGADAAATKLNNGVM